MKISRQSTDTLVIDHIPWLWGIGIGAFALLLLGIGMMLMRGGDIFAGLICLGFAALGFFTFRAVVVRNQAYFHLPSGVVELRKRKIGGTSSMQIALADIDRAIVQTLGGDSKTHRFALQLRDGTEHPLTRTYFSGSGARRAADAANTWLDAYVDSTRAAR